MTRKEIAVGAVHKVTADFQYPYYAIANTGYKSHENNLGNQRKS
jgi:hypothetical protein